MEKFYLVRGGNAEATVWVKKDCAGAEMQAAKFFAEAAAQISGAKNMQICEYSDINGIGANAVVFVSGSLVPGFLNADAKQLEGTDGFSVRKNGGAVYVYSPLPQGIFYGAHSLIEENANIIWPRAKKGFDVLFDPSADIVLSKCDYLQKPHFRLRGWNLCGIGAEGDHLDTPSIIYQGRNKNNIKMLEYLDGWQNYGMNPHGDVVGALNKIDDEFLHTHPEYFMTDSDGVSPRPAKGESFFNYYNMDSAAAVAERIARYYKEGKIPFKTLRVMMPDDPYFYMLGKNGEKLHELPFTTDGGVTVQPNEECYKSTVYFSFLNEIARLTKISCPDLEICTFAYMYSVTAPKVKIRDNIVVWVAPINANDHFAYTDDNSAYTNEVRQNFIDWTKVCKNLAVYNYWLSFNGSIYSRPMVKVVQKNLQWYRSIGIDGLVPEGRIDPEKRTERNPLFYDLNEMYIWQMNRLMWDPDLDIPQMTDKFCRLAYGKAAGHMKEYYALLQKGWDNSEGMVRYFTGGDVYTLDFIINAGIAGGVSEALNNAYAAAETDMQKTRIRPILEVVTEQIRIFSKAVKEDWTAAYTDAGADTVLSEKQADIMFNPGSVWNKAVPIKVLKDFNTMEDYTGEAGFSARMLWDKEYLYISFCVFDDKLGQNGKREVNSLGADIARREDGKLIDSYIEMYIGGNSLNTSKYYGYFSGFFQSKGVQFYVNDGGPLSMPPPEGFRVANYTYYNADPKKRYYTHIQAISFKDLDVRWQDATPCGSFVYYNDRYGRAGWKGNGLWTREKFSVFTLEGKEKLLNKQ